MLHADDIQLIVKVLTAEIETADDRKTGATNANANYYEGRAEGLRLARDMLVRLSNRAANHPDNAELELLP